MKTKFLILILILCFCLGLNSCDKAEAVIPENGDISADDYKGFDLTIMNMKTGAKTGERVISDYFRRDMFFLMDSWQPENGDLFFYRGKIRNDSSFYPYEEFGHFLAIVPLEEEFYWNGVGLYYNGFIYRITPTENGPRIYNRGLWTLGRYCVLVQASSNISLPPDTETSKMMAGISKIRVRRGHIKKDKFAPQHDKATPAGVVWGFYKNKGKNIKPDGSGEYIRAEDFITKTDANSGYFDAATSNLVIKKIQIYSDPVNEIDCSKVY